MEGKASFSVFSACCSGANGRGGFGGATSSPDPGCGTAGDGAAFGFGGDVGVSVGSSSKSSALAVVGDSGRSSGFYDNCQPSATSLSSYSYINTPASLILTWLLVCFWELLRNI